MGISLASLLISVPEGEGGGYTNLKERIRLFVGQIFFPSFGIIDMSTVKLKH